MYLIDDRTMSLEEAADLLADLVERQGPLDVQIRFDPRFPLDALTRLEEVCRAVGVAHTGLMPVLALPATAPSDRKE